MRRQLRGSLFTILLTLLSFTVPLALQGGSFNQQPGHDIGSSGGTSDSSQGTGSDQGTAGSQGSGSDQGTAGSQGTGSDQGTAGRTKKEAKNEKKAEKKSSKKAEKKRD